MAKFKRRQEVTISNEVLAKLNLTQEDVKSAVVEWPTTKCPSLSRSEERFTFSDVLITLNTGSVHKEGKLFFFCWGSKDTFRERISHKDIN